MSTEDDGEQQSMPYRAFLEKVISPGLEIFVPRIIVIDWHQSSVGVQCDVWGRSQLARDRSPRSDMQWRELRLRI